MNYKKAGKSVKNEARKRSVYGPFGGAAGIRTLVSFQTNGFQVLPVNWNFFGKQ